MEIIIDRMICLSVGLVLDMLLGDPYCLPHPVRWIGALIAWLEKRLWREDDSAARKRHKGILLAVLMLIVSGGATFIGLYIAYHVHRAAGIALESILCYQMLSMRCLKVESMKVCHALRVGNMERARSAVSMIVGRDTQRLDAAGITRAAVETVAENTSDGVIAPMFYLALGGAAFGVLYKTINTMDSMIGYKNERYMDFGRCAAKLDDAANYVPSRLAAVLMIFGTVLCKLTVRIKYCFNGHVVELDAELYKLKTIYDSKNAWRIYRRDRRQHASPNSAQTEAVCAGALGIRLAGEAWYFGTKVDKPYIGDDLRPIEPEDIRRANCLLYAASLLMWVVCMTVLAGCALWFT